MKLDIPKTAGIYRFLNWINGKMYIGSAINLMKRREEEFNAGLVTRLGARR